jgi:hypothetical protein
MKGVENAATRTKNGVAIRNAILAKYSSLLNSLYAIAAIPG